MRMLKGTYTLKFEVPMEKVMLLVERGRKLAEDGGVDVGPDEVDVALWFLFYTSLMDDEPGTPITRSGIRLIEEDVVTEEVDDGQEP